MASAIGARHDGDDYQSRLFWLRACDLFNEDTHVVAIAYEEGLTRAFDDVVVYFDSDMKDEDGQPLRADHVQAKFHRWPSGSVTWDALMDPAFIGADRFSLLHRLRDAYRQHLTSGGGRRFTFDTPWVVDPRDPLAEMLALADERIHLPVGKGGRRRSRVHEQVIGRLLEHLELDDEGELAAILATFRLHRGVSLAEIGRQLNERLRSVGLVPVEAGHQVHPYDDLTRRVVRGRCAPFTRDDIERLCKQERLWHGHTTIEAGAVRLGIRSFARRTEELAEETDALLDLLDHFDGRFPRDAAAWDNAIFPAIERFLAQCERAKRYHLHLHTHGSIAFAAGYCLDPKAGVDAVPVQRSIRGPTIWRPAVHPAPDAYPLFTVTEYPLAQGGSEMAITISATKEIGADVEAYVQKQLPEVRRIAAFVPQLGPGSEAVLDCTHAHLLAQQIVQYSQTARTAEERRCRLHLFAAAPNGLLYFLGQQARGLGQVVWYEFDFERNEPGGYRPALTFPPRAQQHGAA